MMSALSIAAAILAATVAAVYFERLNPLQFKSNDKIFVTINVLLLCCCIWSTYTLVVLGFGVLNVLTPIVAALYLIRSHDVFVQETRPGELNQAPEHSY